MLGTAGEVKISLQAMIYYGHLRVDTPVLSNQVRTISTI